MTSASLPPEPGGFLHPTLLPSPPLSAIASPSIATHILPQTRSHPLKPGSSKESSFIDYVDRKLLGISRRYEKRSQQDVDGDDQMVEGKGYRGFGEVAKDLEKVVDITPYLLTIALTVSTYLRSFPFSPRPTFSLLRKLDLVFSSLLQGRNLETGDVLSGFEGGRGKVSTTEKVRMRGLVSRTRVVVVEMAGKGTTELGISSATGTETDTEGGITTDNDTIMNDDEDNDDENWEMEVARVYERTIVDLGDALDAPGNSGFG
ncbi:MAG: hypothetical protein Q9187_003789 [Circinaria calcarea]